MERDGQFPQLYLMTFLRVGVSSVLIGLGAFAPHARAALFNDFTEAGTQVNGFQDDFSTTTRNSGWSVFGNDVFSQSGDGTLNIMGAAGDPNKLLYTGAPYSDTVQEVLMLMRNNGSAVVDGFRSGPATASNFVDGQGINLHFREDGQNGPGRHFNLLNDARAWGPVVPVADWTQGDYFWLRLGHEPNAPAGANNLANGAFDAFGKIWRAGTGEPAGFQVAWDYGGDRTGFAGIAGPSLGSFADFSADYVLIKAAGLPSITVVPEPSSLLIALTAGILLAGGSRRRAH